MATLTRWDIVRVFMRSLWLQASWSFRGMQTLGWAWSMEPVLRRLYRGDALREASLRYLDLFNSNPIMAAAILGAAVHVEAEGGEDVSLRVSRLRTALMGPYGAVGDSFFWGGAKPAIVLAALVLASSGVTWAPWFFFGAFVLLNMGMRLLVFQLGLRQGMGVAAAVIRLNLPHWAQRLKCLCAALVGCFVVLSSAPQRLLEWGIPYPLWLLTAWSAVLIGSALVRRGVGPGAMLGMAAFFAVGSVWFT